ncbi:MAG: CheR family methyltransferase [Pseudomarimonas sp.]
MLELMRTRLGLDASSLGERVLDDACADARRNLGVGTDAELYQRVLSDTVAFAQCSECFVVPESWFFRTAEQFDDLVRFAREHVQREHRPLRILSLPCAAGEEAYSAVIILLEAGLRPDQIDVLGIDVSHVTVSRAQAGAYRQNALRGTSPVPIWMQEGQDGFRVVPAVRGCARFRQGNALDPLLLHGEAPFDVIFCRNLLIYLHADARQRVISTLLAALQTPGLILAGQAEVLSSLSSQLLPLEGGCPLSFVRRAAPEAPGGATHSSTLKLPTARRRAEQAKRDSSGDAGRSSHPGGKSHVAREPTPKPLANGAGDAHAGQTDGARREKNHLSNVLAEAHRLADAGHTMQARERCLQWLSQHPADVDAHFLLGLLESANGDTEAADRAFTKVLYLDRNHLDALQQRIGLAQRRGANDQADELRARAARLRSRNEPGK